MTSPLQKLNSFGSRGGLLLFLAVLAHLCLFMQSNADCAGTDTKNLLKNPGFEEGKNEQPAVWRSFVVPAEGVQSLWDKDAYRSGKRSVMLHIETPYKTEVYDNWYQHVPALPSGRKLVLSGYMKTENVTEAAIWIQCWSDSSQEVIRFATTTISYPISGTADWTRVETSIIPPSETAFLTVRCVVAGTGTAWFDDLTLTPERKPDKAPLPDKVDAKPRNVNSDALEKALDAHKILLETNRKLTENAANLAKELRMLREDLNELRVLIDTWLQENQKSPDIESAPAESVPPFRPITKSGRNSR